MKIRARGCCNTLARAPEIMPGLGEVYRCSRARLTAERGREALYSFDFTGNNARALI